MVQKYHADLNKEHPGLNQFRGSLQRYKNEWMLLTPGSLHVAEELRGWSLIDLITNMQLEAPIAGMPDQVWRLQCSGEGYREGVLTCSDGNFVVRWTQTIGTDFVSPGVELWVANFVIHLPQEH